MELKKIDVTKNELLELLSECCGIEVDCHNAKTYEVADNILDACGYSFCAVIAEYANLKGKHYVVHWEDECSDEFQAYDMTDCLSADTNACEIVLRHLTSDPDTLAMYRVELEFELATDGDENVMIWTAYNYKQDSNHAPINHFAIDENTNKPMLFADTEAAHAWLEDLPLVYFLNLGRGETARPTYSVVCNAHVAA